MGKVRRLQEALRKFEKVRLGAYPTPLHYLPRFSSNYGVKVFIKREDLSGPALTLSGNKTRMLEYRLGKALKEGAEVVVGGFDLQSNHARQLVAAAKTLGLDVKLFLRKGGWPSPFFQGNYLIDKLLGADIEIVDGSLEMLNDLVLQEADRIRGHGRRVYVTGGYYDEVLSTIAFVECGLELVYQFKRMRILPRYIYVASSGATQAGLMLALKYLGAECTVIGISYTDEIEDTSSRIAELANGAAEMLGLNVEIKKDDVLNCKKYVGQGYWVPPATAIEAIEVLAKVEGILLDPIYTGRAMAALVEDICAGKVKNQTVVFVHTGGLPLLFCYSCIFINKTL